MQILMTQDSLNLEEPTTLVELDSSYQLAVLHVRQDLDDLAFASFGGALHSAIDGGCRDIIVDLGRSHAIGSAAIGAIQEAFGRFGGERGRITLTRCDPLPGDREMLHCYSHVHEAMSALFRSATEVFKPIKSNGMPLRTWLRSASASLQMAAPEQEAIEAAASEAFSNAVQYAAPDKDSLITVRLLAGSTCTVEVQDRGAGFEARQYFAVDPCSLHMGARGLGIYVMRNLVDHVEFIAGASSTPEAPAGTTVRLVKRLAAQPCRAQSCRRQGAGRPKGR